MRKQQNERRETGDITATETDGWKHFKCNGDINWLNVTEVDENFWNKFSLDFSNVISILMVIMLMKCHNLRLNSNKWGDNYKQHLQHY